MDQGLWQTPESINILHPSHMWISTVLLCGQYCKTMQTGTVSRLQFCRRPWRLKIYFGWNTVRFGKSYIRTNKLDVQETKVCLTQFNGSWDYLWMGSQLSILGIWFLKFSILPWANERNPKEEYRETCRVTHHQTSTSITKLKHQFNTITLNWALSIMFHRTRSLLNWCDALHFWW